MAQLSEETKSTTGGLLNFLSTKLSFGASSLGKVSNAELLGYIYDLMMQKENDDRTAYQDFASKDKIRQQKEEMRHREIVSALSFSETNIPKAVEKQVKKTKQEKIKKSKPERLTKAKSQPKIRAPKATKTSKSKGPVASKPVATKPTTASKIPSAAVGMAGAVIAAGAVLGSTSALANVVSKHESGSAGYNAYNKGTVGDTMIPSDKPIDFSTMTIADYFNRTAKTNDFPEGKLKPGDPDVLFAVGKYQITPNTMKALVKAMNLDPNTTVLDAPTQDMLFEKGLIGSRRKQVDAYVKGYSSDRDAAIMELAKEFASIGVPYDVVVDGKTIKKGESYYKGKGGNKALTTPEQVGDALDADRLRNVSRRETPPTQIPSNNIDELSKENQKITEALKSQSVGNVNNVTNFNNQNIAQGATRSAEVNDRPAYERKSVTR
jgi:hypothetical protein